MQRHIWYLLSSAFLMFHIQDAEGGFLPAGVAVSWLTYSSKNLYTASARARSICLLAIFKARLRLRSLEQNEAVSARLP